MPLRFIDDYLICQTCKKAVKFELRKRNDIHAPSLYCLTHNGYTVGLSYVADALARYQGNKDNAINNFIENQVTNAEEWKLTKEFFNEVLTEK